MDASNVSNNSTRDGGAELIADIWEEQKFFSQELIDLKFRDAERIKFLFTRAAHRLAFLEMVTKGLTEMDKHDAKAYAKFVEKKRKIEDMDIDELRVLLR